MLNLHIISIEHSKWVNLHLKHENLRQDLFTDPRTFRSRDMTFQSSLALVLVYFYEFVNGKITWKI